MTHAARISRDDVLSALHPIDVLEHFGVAGRRAGREFRTRTCPTCGPRSREGVSINLESGRWRCHMHGCAGDVLDLVAAFAGFEIKSDFERVLELAAEIAGVDPRSAPAGGRARSNTERHELEQTRRAQEEAERRARRADAIMRATAQWNASAARSPTGEAYLARRGVADVRELGLVRFDAHGNVAVALHTADARIVNVVRRRLAVDEPKVLGMRACPTAGTFGDSVADITNGRDVVLVEGLFDSLTARLAWPSATILGAHGANNLERIAAAAALRVRVARTRLLLVPHDDDAGERSMVAAGRAALRAGLRYGRSLAVVDCGAPDLNDAWCAGWRPS